MNICHMTYHRADDNVFETAIKTFREVSPDSMLVVTTDNVPEVLRDEWNKEYSITWDVVDPSQMEHRRATCKIERLKALMDECEDGDCILVSDVDTYFLADPFAPFEEWPDMQLGLTTRGYEYAFPINAGVFFIRVCPKMREWIKWHLEEIFNPKWHAYVQIKKKWNHYRKGLDWSVGQDFLIACWNERKRLFVRVRDVGPMYNFCPPTDLWGSKAKDMVVEAYQNKSASILHLKSQLKRLVYDGRLPGCVTRHPKGRENWENE